MERFIISELLEWKNSQNRKPLILRGAAQVGKTRVLQKFGKDFFENCIYEDLNDNKAMKELFQSQPTAEKIVSVMNDRYGDALDEKNTLIIFDGIQEVPEAVLCLKTMYEQASQYYIAATSCIMGIGIYDSPFVQQFAEVKTLYPLNFCEFIKFTEGDEVAEYVENNRFTEDDRLHGKSLDLLRTYLQVGGMPQAVDVYKKTGSIEEAAKIQKKLLNYWIQDLWVNSPRSLRFKARKVWQSAAKQLTKENKKFMYKDVSPDARGKTYRDAMEWLEECGLIYRVGKTEWDSLSMEQSTSEHSFKAYFVDVGLLSVVLEYRQGSSSDRNEIFEWKNKALTEQFICQELISYGKRLPQYWSSKRSIGRIDFISEIKENTVAIEIQAEENNQAKNLKSFKQRYNSVQAFRFSQGEYKDCGHCTNIPLYGARALF